MNRLKERLKIIVLRSSLLLVFTLATALTHAAGHSANMTLMVSVVADCSFDMASTLTMPDLPMGKLSGRGAGDKLADYKSTLLLKASCNGTQKYKYTFSPAIKGGSCIGTDTGHLNYCLSIDNTDVDLSAGSAVYEVTQASDRFDDAETLVTVIPQVGEVSPKPGTNTAVLTVTIEPS
ncbi:hypothetical protein [Rouxiella sp. Mn2063]|uniref:hypothetical protein n=1 Tax=Rouxiella sp. Mn2063 TaxID=3395262 RepID=UPI003BDB7629